MMSLAAALAVVLILLLTLQACCITWSLALVGSLG